MDHEEMLAASVATRRGTQRAVGQEYPTAVRPLADRPRTIITIESGFDDPPSLFGLLLFATEIRLEGIVHPGNESVDEALAKYEAAYSNLVVHDQRYPDPDYVRSLVRGMDAGDSGHASGAELIADALLDDDHGPVYIQAWEGTGAIQAALALIDERLADADDAERTRSAIISRAVISTPTPPDELFADEALSAWSDIRVTQVASDLWTYPHMLPLIAPGLRGHEHPSFGGWGGRAREVDDAETWTVDGVTDAPEEKESSVARWFDDAQADFAERVRWSTTPEYADANHHPELEVTTGLDVDVRPGGRVALVASISDPDGDDVTCRWWHYREASTFAGTVDIAASGEIARVAVPVTARPDETIHIVVEAIDASPRPLKTYRRVILTVH